MKWVSCRSSTVSETVFFFQSGDQRKTIVRIVSSSDFEFDCFRERILGFRPGRTWKEKEGFIDPISSLCKWNGMCNELYDLFSDDAGDLMNLWHEKREM